MDPKLLLTPRPWQDRKDREAAIAHFFTTLQDRQMNTSDSPTTVPCTCRSHTRQCTKHRRLYHPEDMNYRSINTVATEIMSAKRLRKAERTSCSTRDILRPLQTGSTVAYRKKAVPALSFPHTQGTALGSRAKVNGSSAQTSLADSGEDSSARPGTQLDSVRALLSHANRLQPSALRT